MSNERVQAFQRLMGKKQALIVEDEDYVAVSLSALLSRFGLLSKCVETGDKAIELLGNQDFDVAFVNLRLPGMSGRDLIYWCNERKKSMPCIVVSGLELEDIVRECSGLTTFMVFQKPMTLDRMENLLLKLNLIWTGHEPGGP